MGGGGKALNKDMNSRKMSIHYAVSSDVSSEGNMAGRGGNVKGSTSGCWEGPLRSTTSWADRVDCQT